ncbi:MAG: RNA ligase family protein [Chloroflexaceae bacterium]
MTNQQGSSMWNRNSYEKMAEKPQQWHLDEAGERQLTRLTWVVTEKIHGANLCVVTDGTQIRCASRRQWLTPADSFFGYQTLVEQLHPAIYATFHLSRQHAPDLGRVAIYGEIFGGAYPHPEVPAIPHVQPVQTGIFYAPGIEFCAFDLAWECHTSTRPRTYVDYELALRIFEQTGLFHATPLLVGSYAAALNYPLGFATTIPRRLKLPPLADNPAEGVVIKPLQTSSISTPRGEIRPILKRKIATFAEDRRYQQAQPWTALPGSEHTGPLAELHWAAYQLITPNRLQNAISKLGYRSPRQRSKGQQLFRLLVDEIQAELAREQETTLAMLNAYEQQQLTAFIQAEVRALLRQHFRQEQRRV